MVEVAGDEITITHPDKVMFPSVAASMVQPVDALEGGELDVGEAEPGSAGADELPCVRGLEDHGSG